jgi:hypothetical protein
MPYRISRLGTVEIRSLDLDRDLDARPLGDLTVELTATNRYRRLDAWSIATGRGW